MTILLSQPRIYYYYYYSIELACVHLLEFVTSSLIHRWCRMDATKLTSNIKKNTVLLIDSTVSWFSTVIMFYYIRRCSFVINDVFVRLFVQKIFILTLQEFELVTQQMWSKHSSTGFFIFLTFCLKSKFQPHKGILVWWLCSSI